MRYCVRCVYPANHPLGLTFDAQGVCSGCRVHEEKDRLDWEERGRMLGRILERFRNRSGSGYDCVVPVSGARDSHFIVDTVKRRYGLSPLLVSYNKLYNTRLGIRNLAHLRTLLDCDFLQQTVDPATVKRLTRRTLERLGSMYWHCLAGQTVFPVQVAVRFKIPLIVWGAHQGLDQVGMFSHLDEVEMTRRYRKDHDLMGLEAEDLAGGDLSAADLAPFTYPHDKEIERVGVRGVYLGNYLRWDTLAQHEAMIARYGYETGTQWRTFDTCNDTDCWHYSDLHDWIKFCKWGYGKVSDHASRELRLHRLTREQAIALVREHEWREPRTLGMFLDWLGMREEEFRACVDARRDPSAWRRPPGGTWELLDSVTRHERDPGVAEARLEVWEERRFPLHPPRFEEREDGYVIIGKGFPG